MTRTHRTPARRFASLASLEQVARRRSRIAAGLGLALGLAVPPLLSTAADLLPKPEPEVASEPIAPTPAGQVHRWKPAPPPLALPSMTRENAGERRRLDLEGMTRR